MHQHQPIIESNERLVATMEELNLEKESSAAKHWPCLSIITLFSRSIIIEWPKILQDKGTDTAESFNLAGVELDLAPLIHRARNVVKCRTSHPTMRIRVCAIGEPDSDTTLPRVVEAFFRATLVKLSGDPNERVIAGRLILTQREGTSATKYHNESGAVANSDGKLIVSQAARDCSSAVLLEQFNENAKTTTFKYEHGALAALFPELVR
ncbi:unnamed protein product [Gongylonema pulchrum]|uniref:Thioredoxin_14 domain-containing protein n=1 Tax=Gongylonema pulchrum TaxID=637853 RepID=A0A183DS51_9BILA|nr:unnamed protein product [Gongylonema pulchrum]